MSGMLARSGVGRSGAFGSGWYAFRVVVTINGTDRTSSVLEKSLRISKGVGDQPSTATFKIAPNPGFTISAGHEVKIGFGSIDNLEFGGQVDSIVHRRRIQGTLGSFLDVQCVDYRRLFDRRAVNYEWKNMSATAIAYDVINQYTSGFSTAAVQPGLANVPHFMADNMRPSDVLRQLSALIGGGFYIDEYRNVHLFAGIGETWRQAAPQALTIANDDMMEFRHERDFSQLRTRVICEGKRTRTLFAFPPGYTVEGVGNYVPVEDVSGFAAESQSVRIGSQRVTVFYVLRAKPIASENTPGTQVRTATSAGATSLPVDSVAFITTQAGWNPGGVTCPWYKVGDQVVFAQGSSGGGTPQLTSIPASGFGAITTPIPVGANVTPLDTLVIFSQPFNQAVPVGTEVVLYEQADNTSAQTSLAAVEGGDGVHEHVIAEPGLDYLGAMAVAEAELDAFDDPDGLLSAKWTSRDLGTRVGIYQDIAMQSPDALSTALTILSIDMTFPTHTARPHRNITGGTVRPAKLLDVVQVRRA